MATSPGGDRRFGVVIGEPDARGWNTGRGRAALPAERLRGGARREGRPEQDDGCRFLAAAGSSPAADRSKKLGRGVPSSPQPHGGIIERRHMPDIVRPGRPGRRRRHVAIFRFKPAASEEILRAKKNSARNPILVVVIEDDRLSLVCELVERQRRVGDPRSGKMEDQSLEKHSFGSMCCGRSG